MTNSELVAEDFKGSIVAVPPIALTPDLRVNVAANKTLVRHIEAGGVSILLYGGNANLYHYDLGRYAEALGMMRSVVAPRTRVIASIGPDYGKAMDQAPLIERAGIRNVMLLPVGFPSDSHGVGDGTRAIAARLGFGVILYLKRDMYVRPVTLAKLVAEGAVRFVKYAVERKDPANDAYLDDVIAAIGPAMVASGMGETPIANHIGKRRLATYTSGAVCIAPRAASRLLAHYRAGRLDAAAIAAEPFLAFERVRAELGGIQVLHDATTASGIADMGPQLPMISRVKPQFMDQVRQATAALMAAENSLEPMAASQTAS